MYTMAVGDKRQMQSDSLWGTQDNARQNGGLGARTMECVPEVETLRSSPGHEVAVCRYEHIMRT